MIKKIRFSFFLLEKDATGMVEFHVDSLSLNKVSGHSFHLDMMNAYISNAYQESMDTSIRRKKWCQKFRGWEL